MKDEKEIHNSDERAIWLWCLHCERAYLRGEFRLKDGLQYCPYPGCDGDTVIDAWNWFGLRSDHKAFPVVPERGVRYPLYPVDKE